LKSYTPKTGSGREERRRGIEVASRPLAWGERGGRVKVVLCEKLYSLNLFTSYLSPCLKLSDSSCKAEK